MTYPTHRLRAHGPKPDYSGSGALHNRFEKVKDERNVARGDGAMFLKEETEQHANIKPKKEEHGAKPGHTHNVMKIGKSHGFRAHGVAKNDATVTNPGNPLRFSGNKDAHRIGARKGGRFGKSMYVTEGMPNMKCKVAGIEPIGNARDKVQRGNVKQPHSRKK